MTKQEEELKKRCEKLTKEQRAFYKTIGKCHCPALKEDVIFNSKGFRHLRYDGLGHARSIKEQIYRLRLVPLIIPVIKNATIAKHTPADYNKSSDKYIEYWELKEVVGKQKTAVTVILRRIGTGNITFLSVWKKQKSRKTKKTV